MNNFERSSCLKRHIPFLNEVLSATQSDNRTFIQTLNKLKDIVESGKRFSPAIERNLDLSITKLKNDLKHEAANKERQAENSQETCQTEDVNNNDFTINASDRPRQGLTEKCKSVKVVLSRVQSEVLNLQTNASADAGPSNLQDDVNRESTTNQNNLPANHEATANVNLNIAKEEINSEINDSNETVYSGSEQFEFISEANQSNEDDKVVPPQSARRKIRKISTSSSESDHFLNHRKSLQKPKRTRIAISSESSSTDEKSTEKNNLENENDTTSSNSSSSEDDFYTASSKSSSSNQRRSRQKSQKGRVRRPKRKELDQLQDDLQKSFIGKEIPFLKCSRERKKVRYDATEESNDDSETRSINFVKYTVPERRRKNKPINTDIDKQNNENNCERSVDELESDRTTPDNLVQKSIKTVKQAYVDENRSTPDIDFDTNKKIKMLERKIDEENDTADCSSGPSVADDSENDECASQYEYTKSNLLGSRVLVEKIMISNSLPVKVCNDNGIWKISAVKNNKKYEEHEKQDKTRPIETENGTRVENAAVNENRSEKVYDVKESAKCLQIQRIPSESVEIMNIEETSQNKENTEENTDDNDTNSEYLIIDEIEHEEESGVEIKDIEALKVNNETEQIKKSSNFKIIEQSQNCITIYDSSHVVAQNDNINKESSKSKYSCENNNLKGKPNALKETAQTNQISKNELQNSNSIKKKPCARKSTKSSPNKLVLCKATPKKSPSKAIQRNFQTNTFEKKVLNLSYLRCRAGFQFKCQFENCPYYSMSESDFKYHLQSRHGADRWAGYCNICDKSVSGTTLPLITEFDHMLKIHINEELRESEKQRQTTNTDNCAVRTVTSAALNIETFSLSMTTPSLCAAPSLSASTVKDSTCTMYSKPSSSMIFRSQSTVENLVIQSLDQLSNHQIGDTIQQKNVVSIPLKPILRVKSLPGDLLSSKVKTPNKANDPIQTSSSVIDTILIKSSENGLTTATSSSSAIASQDIQVLNTSNQTKTQSISVILSTSAVNHQNTISTIPAQSTIQAPDLRAVLNSQRASPNFRIISNVPSNIQAALGSTSSISDMNTNQFDLRSFLSSPEVPTNYRNCSNSKNFNNYNSIIHNDNSLNQQQCIKTEIVNAGIIMTNELRPWIKNPDKKRSNLISVMQERRNLFCLYKCMFLNCTFCTNIEKEFTNHLWSHQSRFNRNILFFCCYCQFKTERHEVLVSHITKTYKFCKYTCSKCFYRTPSQYNIEEHLKMHKAFNTEANSAIDKYAYDISEDQEYKKIKILENDLMNIACPICNHRGIHTYRQLREHCERYHKVLDIFRCQNCSKRDQLKNIKNHLERCCNIYNFKCCYCMFGSQGTKDMSTHLTEHHMSKIPFYIEQTDTSFHTTQTAIKAACIKKF